MSEKALSSGRAIRPTNYTAGKIGKVLLYAALILLSVVTLVPFVWMLSASLKLDREVFEFPIRWIPQTFHWENYSLIWTKAPMLMYAKNLNVPAEKPATDNLLGWQAGLTAGIIDQLFKREITREALFALDNDTWRDILLEARKMAERAAASQETCL